jgi:hypothetical protein
MANEDLAEWGGDGWVEAETIRATIDAYSKGQIELPTVTGDTNVKYVREASQNFVTPSSSRRSLDDFERPYTKSTIAEFLHWARTNSHGRLQPDPKCEVAFAAIDTQATKITLRVSVVRLPSRRRRRPEAAGAQAAGGRHFPLLPASRRPSGRRLSSPPFPRQSIREKIS